MYKICAKTGTVALLAKKVVVFAKTVTYLRVFATRLSPPAVSLHNLPAIQITSQPLVSLSGKVPGAYNCLDYLANVPKCCRISPSASFEKHERYNIKALKQHRRSLSRDGRNQRPYLSQVE